jgi:hypothetical protein
MSAQERTRQALHDVGLGVGTVGLAVVLTFWGSLAAVQAVIVLMMVALLVWMFTTDLDKLRGASGWPRPFVFGGLATLTVVNASVFSFTGLAGLLLSTIVLGVVVVVGLTRVLRRIGT